MITHLLYGSVLTGVGHSTANMPSDRPTTALSKGNNDAPFMSMGDQSIAMKTEIKGNTFGEFLTVMPYFSMLILPQGTVGNIGSHNTINQTIINYGGESRECEDVIARQL